MCRVILGWSIKKPHAYSVRGRSHTCSMCWPIKGGIGLYLQPPLDLRSTQGWQFQGMLLKCLLHQWCCMGWLGVGLTKKPDLWSLCAALHNFSRSLGSISLRFCIEKSQRPLDFATGKSLIEIAAISKNCLPMSKNLSPPSYSSRPKLLINEKIVINFPFTQGVL